MQPILNQTTFWLPAIKNGTDFIFFISPVYIFTFFFVKLRESVGHLCFVSVTVAYLKKKNQPEMSTISRVTL